MGYRLSVETAFSSRGTNLVCRACSLHLDDLEFEVDLVVLDMIGYDVILGMDWLATFHAVLDCYGKSVLLQLEDGSVVKIRG